MTVVLKQTPDLTRQLVIIHVSDTHFGNDHRFNPERSADGDGPEEEAFPTLLGKLGKDLCGDDPGCPVILCVTGDLVGSGSVDEFGVAEEFIRGLAAAEVLGAQRGMEAIFSVPGNHDVKWDSDDVGVRWQQWTEFHNRLYETDGKREDP